MAVRHPTQDVCGCPCVSVFVRVCPYAHTGGLWLSISTHISTLVLGLSMLALPVDCLGDFGPRGLSVQYTQDVRGCPSAHTGCPCVSVSTHRTSVAVRVCPCVSVSTHRTSVCVCQHTHDVRGCLCLSVSTHMTSMAVRVCPCEFVSTQRMSVPVHQYTYQHACPRTQHAVHTGRPWVSASTHMTSVAVRVCPSAHTERPWLSVCVRVRPRVSMCVNQHTQNICGCPSLHISARWSLDSAHWPFPWTVRVILAHVGCLFSTHRTSVGVRQRTQDIRGCPWLSVSTHRTSVAVRVCPSAHTGRPWLSISTHISTLVLGLSTLALTVDCSGDFGPRGLSVQYTQDVCGCPSAHTGHPCVSVRTHRTSVAVRVCPSAHKGRLCVSVSTHKTSVAVRVCPCVSVCVRVLSISTHISTFVLGLSTLALPMDCLGVFGPRGLSVQYIEDVCGCPSAYTGCPCVRQDTQDVRVCPSAHTGHPWLSISTHISTLLLGLNTMTLPVDCSGNFGPRWLSVQYTQYVRGCPPAHTGCMWLSMAVCGCPSAHTGCLWLSVCIRLCACVSVSTHRMSVAVHQYTYQHAGPWTQHAGPSRGMFG
ncbi:hypothetical protein YC2023_066074 [Brassica napus]